jgi:membrane-associated protease RseP (regulator of RpoE activity)
MINGYVIALIVFLAYLGLIYVLKRTKWLDRHSMSLQGPLLLWRTRRGKAFIERVASKRRFWSWYGKAALWICLISMIAIMVLLVWEATIVPQIKTAPSPQLVLGIPGINPIIPIWYGILGLLVAIVVHEFAHGIMTRAGGMKVQSLGLVFLVFPIGAFVEPDEKDLQDATRSKRAKVYAVGPGTNIVLSLVVLSLFCGVFMSSLEPTHEGALISVTTGGVVVGSPAERSGLTANCVVVSIDGTPISSTTDLNSRVSPNPGALVNVSYYYAGRLHAVNMTDGLVVAFTTSGFAAANASLETGMVLTSLNGTIIGGDMTLRSVMAHTRAGQTINVTAMSYDSSTGRFVVNSSISTIQLSDKFQYYEKFDPDHNSPAYHGVGFLGAGFSNLGMQVENASYYQETLTNPFKGDKSFTDYSFSALRLIALPFLHLAPLRTPVTDIYHPAHALSWMPDSAFWILANSLYWIFWLNLMVGLTNVLPAVPLDGGYLFRDFMDYLLSKTGKTYTKEQRDKIVGNVVLALALVVLGLILWQLVGPALNH